MNPIIEYGPRALYSIVLIAVSGLLLSEVWRVWTDDRLYLSAFTYERDGSVQKDAGVSFARRVGHGLRRVNFIYQGGAFDDAPLASTDQLPRGLALELPEIRSSTFETVEVQAYGVNFSSLLRGVRNWVDQPNEISGYVSHYGQNVEVQAGLNGNTAKLNQGGSSQTIGALQDWSVSGNTIPEASFMLACAVFRYVAANRYSYFKVINDSEFHQFVRALEHYQKYRMLISRNVPENIKALELKAADELVQPLLGSRFPFAEKLAGLIQNEQKSYEAATEYFEDYLAIRSEYGEGDEPIASLAQELRELQASATVPPPSGSGIFGRSRVRPIVSGVSISSANTLAGTLCCFVKKAGSAEIMALTAEHTVGNAQKGVTVLQPGKADGGEAPADAIGTVMATLSPTETNGRAAGALIRLASSTLYSTLYSTAIPAFGSITGVETNITPGMDVVAFGRTSGRSIGKITTVDLTIKVEGGSGPLNLNGMIGTEPFSKGGDSGAPVLTEQGKLIGFVYAGGAGMTVIMPIQPVLDAFGVELVLN